MSESLVPEPDVSEENPVSTHWIWAGHHRPPIPRQFAEYMTTNWADDGTVITPHPAAAYFARRRAALAAQFPDETIVVPSGGLVTRANDTDYRFRPGSDLFYLTGCHEADCVLVITPTEQGPRTTLYVPRRRDRHTHEFFTDARYGELWVGRSRGVDEAATYYDIETASLEYLEKDLSSIDPRHVVVARGYDRAIDDAHAPSETDEALLVALGDMRLVKDDYEIAQLQLAIDFTEKGFEDVVRALPAAKGRGERVIEGVFGLRARVEGNDVGYGTIAASGHNATVLHWTDNDGVVRDGELLLLDAGVECHELYTADVTRTMPINGTFSDAQRRVYDTVYAAQQAAIEIIRPGVGFRDVHEAAMRVIIEWLLSEGLLDEPDVETALRPERRRYTRYTLHGTSHMLGIDVHDCAHARNDVYFGELREGYVLTVEPGLYFQANDLTIPEHYRGIGVRIEDDILVTADGYRNMSGALPRRSDEVEAWMARLASQAAPNLGL